MIRRISDEGTSEASHRILRPRRVDPEPREEASAEDAEVSSYRSRAASSVGLDCDTDLERDLDRDEDASDDEGDGGGDGELPPPPFPGAYQRPERGPDRQPRKQRSKMLAETKKELERLKKWKSRWSWLVRLAKKASGRKCFAKVGRKAGGKRLSALIEIMHSIICCLYRENEQGENEDCDPEKDAKCEKECFKTLLGRLLRRCEFECAEEVKEILRERMRQGKVRGRGIGQLTEACIEEVFDAYSSRHAAPSWLALLAIIEKRKISDEGYEDLRKEVGEASAHVLFGVRLPERFPPIKWLRERRREFAKATGTPIYQLASAETGAPPSAATSFLESIQADLLNPALEPLLDLKKLGEELKEKGREGMIRPVDLPILIVNVAGDAHEVWRALGYVRQHIHLHTFAYHLWVLPELWESAYGQRPVAIGREGESYDSMRRMLWIFLHECEALMQNHYRVTFLFLLSALSRSGVDLTEEEEEAVQTFEKTTWEGEWLEEAERKGRKAKKTKQRFADGANKGAGKEKSFARLAVLRKICDESGTVPCRAIEVRLNLFLSPDKKYFQTGSGRYRAMRLGYSCPGCAEKM
uniref:Uncharacterized protein n=1 Tax=Chromera velia CCMP2878 TaxID=1169474 RepID=A0A0G4H8X6_9ALVE|eukprot:Cvel_866.t1-p1 / transcript=Cvel_866.t1 / gene=Cvel_866 / organism=Chromera_velia_CCMP2878 / gene_product=hypothetical protein / transcript_product=hypothetical protein / location=Cvel_scaffold27:61736-64130(-) / protein_length=583 / sequence_SO=supercontig / SO=protein_coding / is_pseudo=false